LLSVTLARFAVLGAVLVSLVYGVLIPLRANTFFHRGHVLSIQGTHDAAISYVTRAVTLDAKQQPYWIELSAAHRAAATHEADLLERRAHLEEARRAAARAIELVPLDGYGHANLGLTLLALATLDPPAATPQQVFQTFDRALAIDETNARFLVKAADAALTLGDLARAQSCASRNRENYPRYAPARLQLGTVALRRSEWESAASEFEAALDGSWRGASGRAEAWKGLARASLELGRPAEALRAAQEAITAAPDDAEAWSYCGRAQEAFARQPGEPSERLRRDAIASYGRAFLLDPGDAAARTALDRLVPN
jgi:tetratricopeptide (TPR) repeat protein